MPNWCNNELEISGPPNDIARLVGDDGHGLAFDRLLPVPPLDNFGDAGYQWRVTHWGTKWDLDDIWTYDLGPGRFGYGFDTAWSPPIAFLEAVAADWPQLTFTLSYAESGGDYAGRRVLADGRTVEVRTGSYQDLCEPVDPALDPDDDDYMVAPRGPLREVCAELPLDQPRLQLDALTAAISAISDNDLSISLPEPFRAMSTVTRGEVGGDALDELITVAALSGHSELTASLVPFLGATEALDLAARAANAMSGSGSAIRILAGAADPAVAAVGRLFLGLGAALTPRPEKMVPWMLAARVTPTLPQLLEQAVEAGRVREWSETAVGLAGDWAGDIDSLLTAAWELVRP